MKKKVVIIGAGPAGLTAAYELLKTPNDYEVTILEKENQVGGICRTIDYHGNKIDIGGHRFFSKSRTVLKWWLNILPIQDADVSQKKTHNYFTGADSSEFDSSKGPDPEKVDKVMLLRNRQSHIYYQRRYFNYPLEIDLSSLKKLGFVRTLIMGISYIKARLFPIKPQLSLKDFMINRFGKQLYETFFRSYTEKVWGVPCERISPKWGAQRIKSLSLTKAVSGYIKKIFRKKESSLKDTPTSLIDSFMYPKYGPGQMWDEVLVRVKEKNAVVRLRSEVDKLDYDGKKITAVWVRSLESSESCRYEADAVISTMPIQDLVRSLDEHNVPMHVKQVAAGLCYRDFITVGLLLARFLPGDRGDANDTKDNWIYIQEPNVKVGRIQIFNNWSPYLVREKDKVWVGMEYFCNQNDELWSMTDQEMKDMAVSELERMGMISGRGDALDGVVIRVEKTYPAYFGTYERFNEIQKFTDSIPNLFLVGRNGMHRYNNQDHSMLSAMAAVENIKQNRLDKSNIWAVNTDDDYQEETTRK